MNNNLKKSLVLVVVVLAFAFYFSSNYHASSSTTDNVSGFSWNADSGPSGGDFGALGWLSFNCTFNNTCGTSNYGVTADASGNLSGYAWSGNVDLTNPNDYHRMALVGFDLEDFLVFLRVLALLLQMLKLIYPLVR